MMTEGARPRRGLTDPKAVGADEVDREAGVAKTAGPQIETGNVTVSGCAVVADEVDQEAGVAKTAGLQIETGNVTVICRVNTSAIVNGGAITETVSASRTMTAAVKGSMVVGIVIVTSGTLALIDVDKIIEIATVRDTTNDASSQMQTIT